MTINMNDSSINTIEDIRNFLNSSNKVEFERCGPQTQCTYDWIEKSLVRFGYLLLNKPEKGSVKQYLEKMTGYSRAQITRLIDQHRKTGHIRSNTKSPRKHRFKTKYSSEDIRLAAKTALLHNKPNGMALKNLFRRAYDTFGDIRFQTLKNISVSYLYVIMNSTTFKRIAGDYEKTRPAVVNIGERRKPDPQGKSGFLRVDSVHQGDSDGTKGVYHIDIVDEVTHWQCVISVPEINMTYMTLALEILLEVFPFEIHEIHSDNGSEYINQAVSKLLTSLMIKLSKNRPRRSNDNALCESKHNIIRKWVGYIFIGKDSFVHLNTFYQSFNEYLNFHRCCLFPTEIVSQDKPGKIIKKYSASNCMTPFEKLKSLPNFEMYLKKGVSVESLNALERKHTDNEMAEIVQDNLAKMYKVLNHETVPVRSGSFID